MKEKKAYRVTIELANDEFIVFLLPPKQRHAKRLLLDWIEKRLHPIYEKAGPTIANKLT